MPVPEVYERDDLIPYHGWLTTSYRSTIELTISYQLKTVAHKFTFFLGVPPKRRGEVWQFLSSQYQARSNMEYEFQSSLGTKEGFMQLCEERTPYEHNIYVDIGKHHMTVMWFRRL